MSNGREQASNPSRSLASHGGDTRLVSLSDLKKLTDERLVERIAHDGCCDSMSLLFERYFRLVLSVGLKILRDPGEAEDVMQEVFFEVFRKANRFNARRGTARIWILQYAYHRSMDRRRYLALRRFYVSYLLWSVGRAQVPEQEGIYGVKPFGEGLQTWVKSAPGFNLDKVNTPLRIEAISGVQAVLGECEIYASLSLQGKPVDLISFQDGQHELQKPLERLASQQGNVDWFRFWLKGEEDPDPAKAKQYARWRELRRLQQETKHKETRSGPVH